MNSIIVYGPPGCGKTTNKDKLAKYFGKSHIVDNWMPGDDIPNDSLILTSSPGAVKSMVNTNVSVFAFKDICITPNMNNFKEELRILINTHCVENLVGMPDYLIAEMLCTVLYTVGGTVKRALCWHGVDAEE